VADLVLGEPAVEPHPVAAFGTAMGRVEDRLYADQRAAGVAYAGIGVLAGTTAGGLVPITSLATYLTVAGTMLRATAANIGDPLARGDLDAARLALPALVGRDPSQLDESEIARAVVESVAENTTDAIVAPALWALLGGARGAYAYRAINTMDAMVGHHSERYERFGWASARLDDLANLAPARVTVALVAAARPHLAAGVIHTVRRDGRSHPSPNGGMAEAAFAAALGVQLGGPVVYPYRTEDRPLLGDGRRCQGSDIDAACRLSRDVTLGLIAALFAAGTVGPPRRRRNRAPDRRTFMHRGSFSWTRGAVGVFARRRLSQCLE